MSWPSTASPSHRDSTLSALKSSPPKKPSSPNTLQNKMSKSSNVKGRRKNPHSFEDGDPSNEIRFSKEPKGSQLKSQGIGPSFKAMTNGSFKDHQIPSITQHPLFKPALLILLLAPVVLFFAFRVSESMTEEELRIHGLRKEISSIQANLASETAPDVKETLSKQVRELEAQLTAAELAHKQRQQERETQLKGEQELREREEREATERQRQEAVRKDQEAAALKEKQDREAKEKDDREVREKRDRESKERQEREAKEKQEREAKERREREAKEKQEREAKERQEREAKEKQERQTKESKDKEKQDREEKERTVEGLQKKQVTEEIQRRRAARAGQTGTSKPANLDKLHQEILEQKLKSAKIKAEESSKAELQRLMATHGAAPPHH